MTSSETSRPAERVVHDLLQAELRDIEQAAADGRSQHKLRQLRQRGGQQHLVEDEYAGRYPFELLQNANDAGASAGIPISARFDVTDAALIISNMGRPFGPDEVQAICDLGASSKDPAKHIGYKGLGFKSVAEITDRPQVWSDGVAFEFDSDRVRDDVELALGAPADDVALPVFAFPYLCEPGSAGTDADLISRLRQEGYTTSIRLPYRQAGDRQRVADDVARLIGPRLLLFLSSLQELVVVGTGERDFTAIIESTPAAAHLRRVDLLWGDGFEEWLVADRTIVVPDQVRAGFEEAWKRVREVRVGCGVRVDESSTAPLPLHVYFPTEVLMPFAALTHGDFMVGLDRRHLKKTHAAVQYNEWLAGELGLLMAVTCETMAEVVGGTAALAAVAPRAVGQATGATVLKSLTAALLERTVIPALGGRYLQPSDAVTLPSGLEPQLAFQLLPLDEHADYLASPDVHLDEAVLTFVTQDLGVSTLDAGLVIKEFEGVDAALAVEGYELLATWVRNDRNIRRLVDALPFVLTTAGARRMASEVFLPPQASLRGEWDPDQVELVEVPSDGEDRLVAALSDLGVEAFDRQKIIELQVIPPLLSLETEQLERERCHRILRDYLADGMGDRLLQRRLGQVLLPVAKAIDSDGSQEWLRADEVYFSGSWMAEGALLERIYGPFGRAEFLAEEPATDPEERTLRLNYFRSLGVRAEPRPLIAETTGHDQYKTTRTWQHPHRRGEPALFDAWLKSQETQRSAECPLGHYESQQIKRSVIVDRLATVLRHGTRDQRLALLAVMSRRWTEVYRHVARAQFHCQIRASHAGAGRDRSTPALFLWQLRFEPWIPATVGDEPVDARPENIWLLDEAGATQGAQLLLPTVEHAGIDPVDLRVLGREIGFISPETITVPSAKSQLRRLQSGYGAEAIPNDGSTRALRGVARWMLNQLRAAARRSGEKVDLSDVPLLAQYGDTVRFATCEYASPDSNLRNRWRTRVPVLLADDAVQSWVATCGWMDLEGSIKVEPRPHKRDSGASETFGAQLEALFPFIAAVATDGATSRETTTLPRLRSLKVVVCEELWLDETIGGDSIEPARVGIYLKPKTERSGSANRRTGTLYVETSSADDNIELGSQMASYLELPRGEGAALSLVFEGEQKARRLLASRAVPEVVISDLAAKLGAPAMDASSLIALPLDEVEFGLPPVAAPQSAAGPSGSAARPAGEVAEGPQGPPTGVGANPAAPAAGAEDLPPLDPDAIAAFEVTPDVVIAIETRRITTKPAEPGASGGRRSELERLEHARSVVAIGDRGEEAAFLFECRRLESMGRDPTEATWDAERNEWSPYDLTSIDEDGQLVYIEVKSTSDSDPSRPFKISARQLEYASRYRGSFWIYRVVDTKSATPTVYRYQDPLGQGNFVGDSALMRLPDHPDRTGT